MNKGHTTTIITIISVLVLVLLSTIFVSESIRVNRIKMTAQNRFDNIEIWLNEGKFSEYKSNLTLYSNNIPNLILLTVKNPEGSSIYLFSSTNINPKIQNEIFYKEQNSYFNTFYKGTIYLNNNIYSLEGIFLTFTQERAYLLFVKSGLIIFLYLIFIICLLIYQKKSSIPNYVRPESISATDSAPTADNNENSLKQIPREENETSSDSNIESPDRNESDDETDKQEEYKDKIGNELKKAAAFDQDIVLVLVGSQGNSISENSDYFHEILKRNFPFHDLIFHYSDNVFALLLPNTDLEQGIHQIELFDQIFVSAPGSFKFPIMFGLSSRNGRLISGHIILKEAHAALNKAMCEPHYPIIGFRPNPARYREYLSKMKPGK
ncbi:MAG: hypothetical protein L3J12_03205 [Spirochaetales bacterium]|nr:hypothetical protein [Spirochaetales bacterium]